MLFALGNSSILDRPCVAILSSREIGEQTLAAMVTAIRTARQEGITTALGGMKSTHRLAAITARAFGANRIVVLDRGLFTAFANDFRSDPFGCGSRKTALDLHSTLILSPFRPEDHAAPNSGRRRDELIAALGDLVFAGSARPGGETERICLTSLARGKPVLVWHDVHNQALQRDGARAVDGTSLAAELTRFRAFRETGTLPARRQRLPPRSLRTGRIPRSREE